MHPSKTLLEKKPEVKEAFDLKKIKEFNHGLIYGFDVEKSCHNYDVFDFRYLLHGIGQVKDMFSAYQYAENTVLKAIREIGIEKITVEQMLEFINQIHLRIARTLADDLQGIAGEEAVAGQYVKSQLYRWHFGVDFKWVVLKYFEASETIDLSAAAKEFGVKEETIRQFLLLLEKILKEKSIAVPERKSQEKYSKGLTILDRLEAQFHADKLTKKDLAIMSEVITICSPPEKLPAMMKTYAENLLKRWRECDPDNLDRVAEFACYLFYNLTEIHPYFNANGRTATCLLNIALRSLGKKSILLRYPDENTDSSSAYSLAIKNINTDQSLLIKHIKARIESEPYENNILEKTVLMRMKLADIILLLNKQIREKNLDILYRQFMSESPPAKGSETDEEYFSRTLEHHYIPYFSDMLKKKLLENKSTKPTLAVSPVVQRQYSQEEKTKIVAKLEELTERKGWKVFKEGNSIAVLLIVDKDKNSQNTALIAALNKTLALQAELLWNPNTKEQVIKIKAIQPEKLMQIKVLEGIAVKPKIEPGISLNLIG